MIDVIGHLFEARMFDEASSLAFTYLVTAKRSDEHFDTVCSILFESYFNMGMPGMVVDVWDKVKDTLSSDAYFYSLFIEALYRLKRYRQMKSELGTLKTEEMHVNTLRCFSKAMEECTDIVWSQRRYKEILKTIVKTVPMAFEALKKLGNTIETKGELEEYKSLIEELKSENNGGGSEYLSKVYDSCVYRAEGEYGRATLQLLYFAIRKKFFSVTSTDIFNPYYVVECAENMGLVGDLEASEFLYKLIISHYPHFIHRMDFFFLASKLVPNERHISLWAEADKESNQTAIAILIFLMTLKDGAVNMDEIRKPTGVVPIILEMRDYRGQKCVEKLDELLRSQPSPLYEHPYIVFERLRCLLKDGKHAAAYKLGRQKMTVRYPGSLVVSAYTLRAKVHMKQKMNSESHDSLLESLQTRKNHLDRIYNDFSMMNEPPLTGVSRDVEHNIAICQARLHAFNRDYTSAIKALIPYAMYANVCYDIGSFCSLSGDEKSAHDWFMQAKLIDPFLPGIDEKIESHEEELEISIINSVESLGF
ncbi:hypothetical protein PCE1_001385 [Barthelona sp. PCE]